MVRKLGGKYGSKSVNNGALECNEISASAWLEGSELVELEDTEAPYEVTNVFVTDVMESSLKLNWSASSSSDIEHYKIYNGPSLLGTTQATVFSVYNLTPDTNYSFTITSVDAANNESNGVTIMVKTAPVRYFLEMSGVDSYFVAPSSLPEHNIIFLEGMISKKDNGDTFYKGKEGYSIMSGAKRNIERIEINGSAIAGNLGNYVPIGEDCAISHYLTVEKSGSFTLFGSNSSNSMPGHIYRITVYHNDTLIADYDTSKGSVDDQSVNGHHGSIIGAHNFIEIE